MNLRLLPLFALGMLLPLFASAETYVNGRNNLNADWTFHRLGKGQKGAFSDPAANAAGWEKVTLPHTPRIEPLLVNDMWQGECWYRRDLDIPASLKGKKLFVHFEGAMQVADVWLNGKHLATHHGGYLPFEIDLTAAADFGGKNVLAVKLLNTDDASVPPGKPLSYLDFSWYGGLYRNVFLVVKDPLRITDAVAANRPSGGGIFVTYPKADASSATVNVRVDVQNDHATPRSATLEAVLASADGTIIARGTAPAATIATGGHQVLELNLEVENPKLWSPLAPNLHTLHVGVRHDGKIVDSESLRIGIRRISFDQKNGFSINGERLYLRGVNRHQEYPFIGYALSDDAHYRDAKKIKEAGFDYVRLSHYPHSPAFMRACDELGLVVMTCIPGWQNFGGDVFRERCFQAARDLVRRDRNHPSVILWELSLNETHMDEPFRSRMAAIMREEYPGDQAYSCAWEGKEFDVLIVARQHGSGKGYKGTQPIVISEYGDWEYYANNAGFNQAEFKDLKKEERNSRHLRSAGERLLLQQAVNFMEAHNDNRTTRAFGDGLWVMYDYNRGYAKDLEASGCMDIFRLPKFGYDFFRSQRPAGEKYSNSDTGPFVKIGSYWTPESPLNVRVYANCDEIELVLNGQSLGRRKPDQNPMTTRLNHPPFTFVLPTFTPGTLKAIGYIQGKAVAQHEVRTPGQPRTLALDVDLGGRPLRADGADAVFLRASVVDLDGTVVTTATPPPVLFEVSGPARIVGPNPAPTEAGIASVLLQSTGGPGIVRIKATSAGLHAASTTVNSVGR